MDKLVKTVKVNIGTFELLQKTQEMLYENKKVHFDLKDIVHLLVSRPNDACELVERVLDNK